MKARLLYRHVTDLFDAAKFEAGSMTLARARLDFCDPARATAIRLVSPWTAR